MSFYTFMPKLFNMSLTASVAIVLVILLRLLLKKAPKVISYVLWGVVLFRLLCPVSIESGLSLYNLLDAPTEESGTITSVIEYVPSNIVHTENPSVALPVPGVSDVINEALPQGEEQLRADPLEGPIFIATYAWMAGVLTMVVYSAVSYIWLRRKLSVVVPLRDNIFIADDIKSPFVVGLFRPKIYLPCNLGEKEQEYIILHEQHHIRRLDHIVKALAFLALAIHWFNPLVWVAFILASKDMEMSCDEAVIRKIGGDVRADYSASLLTLATGRRIIAGTPLAFGEGDTKERINNLSKWKKPAVWVVLIAVGACVVLAVCLLTNPKNDEPDTLPLLHSHSYGVVEVTYETTGTSFSMVAQQNTPVYAITDTMQFMSKGEHSSEDEWTALGTLTEIELTKENFDELFFSKGNWFGKETASAIRKNTANAWTLIYNQDVLYYVLQQKNGEIYLAYGYYDYSEKDDPGSDDTNIRWMFKLAYDLTEDTGLVATSGENVIPVAVFPTGTPLADVKDSVHWLDIAPGPDETVPFTILCDGTEQYGWYSVYDAETMESLDFMRPSGLAPQTYLFQNAEYEHDYIVTLQSEAGDLLCFGARIGDATDPAPLVTKWFDYLDTPSEMEGGLTTELPEYPGVTFQYTENQIIASKPFNSTALTGHTILVAGMPIWNAYFTDLTGDGYPDVCATYTYASGMIDSRIVICDYVNGASYELSDRGYHDFTLWLNDSDGQLYVNKRVYPNDELVSSGRLVFKDDCIQIEEVLSGDSEFDKYYLTIGAESVTSIEVSLPDSSGGCQNADGSPFKMGERIWLENLDGYSDLRGLTITALGENGEVIWTASIPNSDENMGFTHLTQDGWAINNLPSEGVAISRPSLNTEPYTPKGVSGSNVKELSQISGEFETQGGLPFVNLSPGEEVVSSSAITFAENGSVMLFITWGAQDLFLEFGIRAEDGTEYFQEKQGGSSILLIEDIPAGTYRLYIKNSDAYNGVPAYENPDEFAGVSFDATGAMNYKLQ